MRKPPQIFYVVALSAIPSVILGVFGWYSSFVEWLNPAVVAGVIAGVGVILTRVGAGYLRERPAVAIPSVVVGLAIYALTENLIYVIVASVIAGTAARYLLPERLQPGAKEHRNQDEDQSSREADDEGESGTWLGRLWRGIRPIPLRWREMVAPAVLVGAFSVFALRTGAVLSYDRVNSDLAGQSPDLDSVTVIAGLGSFASAMFGGPPLETTPAPMAEAPMPAFSTSLFMGLMAVLTFLGLIGRLGRYVPLQAIGGFLVVIGIPIIMPENLPTVAEAPLAGGVALVVTALSNPFYGILAGQAAALFWL